MLADISSDIRGFVVETFLFGDTTIDLPSSGSFIDLGIIDSTGILELVSHVEDTFGIIVSDVEILPANFDSIDRVTSFVARKMATSQAA